MTIDKVLTKAAKLIENGTSAFACLAITKASDNYYLTYEAILYIKNIYEPYENNPGTRAWLSEHGDSSTDANTQTGRSRRIIALLLAAEIAKDGGL
jgi:hypothetical protein